MRSWLSVLITDAESKKVFDIPIAPSLYSLSNKMDNSLLVVRDINHKYIVVEKEERRVAIKIEKGKIPIWEKYMLTVDEAVQYFGIGEKKIRMLISEHLNSECCFTVQVGCKSLINRKKFEAFLDQTTSL